MAVPLSPSAAFEVSVDSSSTTFAKTVDPAFEERWKAWVARGHRRELATRGRFGFIVISVGIVALVILPLRVL
jgi:hypothetical protein